SIQAGSAEILLLRTFSAPTIIKGLSGYLTPERKDIPPMGSSSSADAIRNIHDFGLSVRQQTNTLPRKPVVDFGSLTVNEEVQRARLPKDVFRALRRSIAHYEALDPSIADVVARALKDWAVGHGST